MSATPFRLLAWREAATRPNLEDGASGDVSPPGGASSTSGELVVPDHRQRADALHAHRKLMRTAFRGHDDLFLNPAWDMMLDLFRNHGGHPKPASTLLDGKGVTGSTASRWLKLLEARGLVVFGTILFADEAVMTVSLSAAGARLMADYLEEI